MDFLIIILVAFGASLLTFFAGFGLGTLMLPVFALFFSVETAVAMTAIVHLLNNLFKLGLMGKHIDKEVLKKFGLLAIIGAILGSWLLTELAGLKMTLYSYTLFSKTFSVTPIYLTIGLLMLGFAVFEFFSIAKKWILPSKALYIGGLFSGFFGGLSGHQGALRSAFLVKAALKKEAFIATGVAVSCLVDVIRLTFYSNKFATEKWLQNWPMLATAVIAAFTGAYVGKKLLTKTKVDRLYQFVAFMLMLFGILLAAGILAK